MIKYFYKNTVASQNVIVKTDIVWVADFTMLELRNDERKKLNIFLCIDLYTNFILSYSVSAKTITSGGTVQVLRKLVKDTFPFYPEGKPEIPVIIDTDRGTQFTSQAYNKFIKKKEGFIVASMSRINSPKDNAVAERFICTFKEHKINNKTFQQELFNQIEINSKFQGSRKFFNLYVKDLNLKSNTKSNLKAPERHDLEASVAAQLMVEPEAFSEFYGPDFRRDHIDQFKRQNNDVISILNEIAAAKAELIEKTPFDTDEQNLVITKISNQLDELYALIQNNPQITKQYVENALEPIQEVIAEIDRKIDILLPKQKRDRIVQKLRDTIDPYFF